MVSIRNSEIVFMSSERLFQQLYAHHISEVSMLNNSADDKSGCNFGKHYTIAFTMIKFILCDILMKISFYDLI
jgi:hypothetical protein